MIKFYSKFILWILNKGLAIIILLMVVASLSAQIDDTGCVGADFGVDAGLYSDVLEYGSHGGASASGTNDWFQGVGPGHGFIDETNTAALTALLMGGGNPTYEQRMAYPLSSIVDGQVMIDALYSRDQFGGTGSTDQSSFITASKNGEDPAIWNLGPSNVLGKNDIIDAGGLMLRDGTTLGDDLWFFGYANRAEPGGSAYIDFEFFVEEITLDPVTGFSSGGPDLGHTAFQFDGSGNITRIGDFVFNTSMINGGSTADIEMRVWVSRDDYDNVTPVGFSWGPEYDGAFNGSPYGYASIIPTSGEACGYVNLEGETPSAPPWGTLNTKSNIYGTTYPELSVLEVGINLTSFGIDHGSILGLDPCEFPINTFMIKSRASASFTAQLKDYSGPFSWGTPTFEVSIIGDSLLSCLNTSITLSAVPVRTDATYLWTTEDGNIVSADTLSTIVVNQPGTYELDIGLPTGCDSELDPQVITFDNSKPLFGDPVSSTAVSCNGDDGSIDLTVSGGTAPYTYDWDYDGYEEPDDDPEDPVGLAPGTHTVVITDAIGCTDTSMVTVDARVAALLVSSQTNVDCNGDNTGTIDMTVTGQDPFTYEWSNGAVTENISGLGAGTYTLITTDADGCTDTLEVTITEPTAIDLNASTTDVTATGVDDGEADLTVSGGTPPYTYDWDNDGLEDPDNDTEDLTGLPSGIYTVIVTDSLGCQDSLTLTIYEPEICNDGIDNDGDGVSDCFDPDCTPPTPGPITASADSVCVGDIGVTYTIDPVAGATGYNWTVPSGATITAGQGSVIITVEWTGTNGGQICVTSDNVGCSSASQSCTTVEPNDVPQTGGSIGNQN